MINENVSLLASFAVSHAHIVVFLPSVFDSVMECSMVICLCLPSFPFRYLVSIPYISKYLNLSKVFFLWRKKALKYVVIQFTLLFLFKLNYYNFSSFSSRDFTFSMFYFLYFNGSGIVWLNTLNTLMWLQLNVCRSDSVLNSFWLIFLFNFGIVKYIWKIFNCFEPLSLWHL